MYQLHIANKNYSSWSLRPWVLMRELAISFEEVMHPFCQQEDWNDYTKFNPSGLVPCLSSEKEIIWDSLAIVEFLAERHVGVWPDDTLARSWARCATAEMHAGFFALRNICAMNCGLRVKLKTISSALQKDITRIDRLWQTGLRKFGGPFLAGGQFSAVDAFYTPVAFRFQTYGISLSDESAAYMQRLLSTQSAKIWYTHALQETDREPGHEAEATAFGEVLQDLRVKSL